MDYFELFVVGSVVCVLVVSVVLSRINRNRLEKDVKNRLQFDDGNLDLSNPDDETVSIWHRSIW